ncbi:11093_t:CDS:2 [Paraglomus brasilianum]|uniref:11093_t:CDS:1 n=1 Tax=Paraglomus brasilianum TaxID=144538 RepID=A0A9N9H0H1_9GLOM|nr:11093_t:CDS:2 [Paraglomus brasilianum]
MNRIWINKLPVELKVEIASYLEKPYLLGCCSREWYSVVNSPHTKYRWLLNKYGRVHALFHAVRIGEPLLNISVIELVLKNSLISRYLVQRLKLVYGKHCLWGNNISNNVYERIINFKEGYRNDNHNDMHSIRQVLKKGENENDIKTIIEVYGFAPFPPKPTFRTYIFENFAKYEDNLPQNGYATASELKVVAKAIIAYPDLLNIWRKIGQAVAEKLCNLQSIGFPLTDTLIGNALLLLFKRRLIDVGESLIEGFSIARKMPKTDVLEMCLIDLLDLSRILEQSDALNYIINSINDPEKQILSAFEKYSIVEGDNNPTQSRTFLKYSPVLYQYMLRFGAKSPVVKYLMKEIIIVHTQLADTENANKLRDADTILDEYYAANVPFDRSLLPLFKECLRGKPISYLFEGYLPELFGSEVPQPFMTFQIPEVDVLTSSTQTKELQRLWLEDIQKCIRSDELVNSEFKRQITNFFTLYGISIPF